MFVPGPSPPGRGPIIGTLAGKEDLAPGTDFSRFSRTWGGQLRGQNSDQHYCITAKLGENNPQGLIHLGKTLEVYELIDLLMISLFLSGTATWSQRGQPCRSWSWYMHSNQYYT